MQQEPTLLGQDAGLDLQTNLQEMQDQGRNSIRIPHTREAISSQRTSDFERVRNAPKITHTMRSACKDDGASRASTCEIKTTARTSRICSNESFHDLMTDRSHSHWTGPRTSMV